MIELVALLRARIPNIDTFERLIIKFVSERTQVMNKANTTKNMSVSLIASLSRRPAIVVNSAILNSLEIVIGAWLRFYPNK